MIATPSITIIKFNLDITFKVAGTRFIKLKDLIYTAIDKHASFFRDFYFIKSDINFLEQNQYIMLRFKYSKTNTKHISIFIMFATTKNSTCLVTNLHSIFIYDLSLYTLLFLYSTILPLFDNTLLKTFVQGY